MDFTKLKSKVISAYDYRKVDLSRLVERFSPDEDALERELLLIRKKNAVMSDADTVAADDFVELSCRSVNSRYNKERVMVRVGKKLFGKEFEEKLVGLKRDEQTTVCVGGDAVDVHIAKITRSTLPPLTDENVKLWSEGSSLTVADLREKMIAQQKSVYISDTAETMAGEVQRIVNDSSTFSLDDAEIEQACDEANAFLKDMFKSNGLDFDALTDEQIKEATGMSTQEHTAFVQGFFLESLKSALISMELIKERNVVFTDDDYEKAVEEQSMLMGLDENEVRKTFTYDTFFNQRISDYYFEQIEEYIKSYLQ